MRAWRAKDTGYARLDINSTVSIYRAGTERIARTGQGIHFHGLSGGVVHEEPPVSAVKSIHEFITGLHLQHFRHWRQAVDAPVHGRRSALILRVVGVSGLAASLWLCLQVNHVSMATLVWVMSLAAAALAVAFTLTWRPHWLAVLVGRFRCRRDAP